MATQTKMTSRILAAVHETARDLHDASFINMRRMRQYDALCLVPVPPYSGKKIRALRDRHKLSQAVCVFHACQPLSSQDGGRAFHAWRPGEAGRWAQSIPIQV